jgi:DNA repair protein RecO (recombination protein O)
MEWSEEAVVLSTRRHGESSIIVEAMTRGRGRHLGLVRGGRSRRMRPVLQAGNSVAVTWRARLDEHLGNFSVEPVAERAAALMVSAAASFAMQTIAAHLRLLPERDPHPRLYDGLTAMLDCLDDPALGAELMVRFELLLLEELGFGLDLSCCAATGAHEDLVYVSPKSGRAVSRAAGAPYENRMLRLPRFLLERPAQRPPGRNALDQGFRLTGYFLERRALEPRGLAPSPAREAFIRAALGVPEAA